MAFSGENIRCFVDIFFAPLVQAVTRPQFADAVPSSVSIASITRTLDTLFQKTPSSSDSLETKKAVFLARLDAMRDALGEKPLFLGVKRYGVWDQDFYPNDSQELLNALVEELFPRSEFSGASFPYPPDSHYVYLLSDGRIFSSVQYVSNIETHPSFEMGGEYIPRSWQLQEHSIPVDLSEEAVTRPSSP